VSAMDAPEAAKKPLNTVDIVRFGRPDKAGTSHRRASALDGRWTVP
jgi:hypothetical protein